MSVNYSNVPNAPLPPANIGNVEDDIALWQQMAADTRKVNTAMTEMQVENDRCTTTNGVLAKIFSTAKDSLQKYTA